MILKSFPSDRQLDLKDCGAACLKSICKFYGKYYSLQYLRDKCGINRDGTNFLDISYAAESIGFKTLAIKATIDQLISSVPLPCIIHWNSTHFVTVYKVSKNKVFISDPAKGLVSYKIEVFLKNWYKKGDNYGSVLLLETRADFKQRSDEGKVERRKTLENILGYFTPYKKSFYTLLVVMLLVTLLQALQPFISKAVIDVGIQTHDLDFINIILIANIIIITTIMLSNAVRDWILLHITARINIALISDYLIKLMNLPVTFFENKLSGDILQRANDHERIRSFIMNNSLNIIFSGLTFIIFSIILLIYNTLIFWIFIGGSTLYVIWIFAFLNLRKKLDWEYFDLYSKNQSYWVEIISSIQDIKINNYEKTKRWKWEKIQTGLYKVNQKILTITNFQNTGGQFIDNLKNVLITFFSAKAVINGEITLGVMIATQFIIGMLNGPVSQFIQFIINAQFAQISFLRLNEINQLPDEDEEISDGKVIFPENKSIFIRGVAYQYSINSPPVIKGINLIIPEGKVTAVVGDSGSGKSTLLKILLRLYKPSIGEIFIGGLNINNINLREWRNRCGAVMQDGKIFNDTILNNITLEEENLDEDRLRYAVKTANIELEILQMPLGYQTMMGEMGRGLSGGQKQRLLIARALYKNPDYLFFDEATNSLDTINEQKIVAALDNVFKNKTVIVVAHRLTTIKNADQIIVMHNGSIVEVGDHRQLLEKKGRYYQLVQSQLIETT